ncbi:uncharacterized protein FMAN_14164 [Fusarium mangiferae]|uniref:BZIP domain-containing protein n=1 Tax=Fusarium mangiferae TaxID=192010 RepID=A0A1L7UIG7_FUSMA|nr:uncharacterized protein FMAN_14164 [Fusarium mangiferae]CVL08193.1 uncharacterized protein FMAN_14164 [Fusarium mangiferae]
MAAIVFTKFRDINTTPAFPFFPHSKFPCSFNTHTLSTFHQKSLIIIYISLKPQNFRHLDLGRSSCRDDRRMSTPAEKANLARIRDNQRRSRARRREYLQELEQRLRVYELQGVEASSEVQHAARRVAEENRQLRGLLNRHGISDDYITSYLNSGTASQNDPAAISHFPNTHSDSVQSLEQAIAPGRPKALETGVSDGMLPQESRESSIASGSKQSFSIWISGQAIQSPSAHIRPLPSNVPTTVPRQSITSSMHPQHYTSQMFPDPQVSRTESYHAIATPGSLMDDPRRHSYSVAPMPGDLSTMVYELQHSHDFLSQPCGTR